MSAQHTPGPWRTDDRYCGAILADGNQVAMATMNGFLPAEIRDANARLIAAAPELLVAAERILAGAESLVRADAAGNRFRSVHADHLVALQAAIAEATGGGS